MGSGHHDHEPKECICKLKKLKYYKFGWTVSNFILPLSPIKANIIDNTMVLSVNTFSYLHS